MSKGADKIRKAVILAAGRSTRLEELSLGKPKPLIEVAGKPLLVHHLENCAANGIEEVFINLFHLPEQIRQLAGDGSKWGLKITYNLEPELAGTAGGVRGFATHLRSGPFLVIYGDNYWAFPMEELVSGHLTASPPPDMSIVLFELEDVTGSGVAVCDRAGWIESFVEKPAPGTEPSRWVNAGAYVLTPGLLDSIPAGASDFGRDSIPTWLREGRRILGIKTLGRVYAVDTPELLRRVQGSDLKA